MVVATTEDQLEQYLNVAVPLALRINADATLRQRYRSDSSSVLLEAGLGPPPGSDGVPQPFRATWEAMTPQQRSEGFANRDAFALAEGDQGHGFQAFWWGFHFGLSTADLVTFIQEVVAAIAAGAVALSIFAAAVGRLLGQLTWAAMCANPPVAAALVVYLVGEAVAIGVVAGTCKCAGIWLSMSWATPGVFVPTCWDNT
jgi:hypothetical protein